MNDYSYSLQRLFYGKKSTRYYNDDGYLHRISGPAIEWEDGHCEWFIDGIQLSKLDFDKQVARRSRYSKLKSKYKF
jgi:hypothetical protein